MPVNEQLWTIEQYEEYTVKMRALTKANEAYKDYVASMSNLSIIENKQLDYYNENSLESTEISVGLDGFNMRVEDVSFGLIFMIAILCFTMLSICWMKYIGPKRKQAKLKKTMTDMQAVIDDDKDGKHE